MAGEKKGVTVVARRPRAVVNEARPGPGQRATEDLAGEPTRQRTVVRQVDGPAPGRQYAEKVFEAGRNVTEEEARAKITEAAEELVDEGVASRVLIQADTPQGSGPIVLESDAVLGGGAAVKRSRATQAPSRGSGASWMGDTGGRNQDMILSDPTQGGVDPEAIAPEDQTVKRARSGAMTPTGEPCTCAFEWEEDKATGEITVYATGAGVATGFKGAPRYMTWCVVCGGERDGQFRPDNPVRYGDQMPAPPKPVNAAAMAARVQENVMEGVQAQVADMLTSDRFLDAIADRMAKKLGEQKAPASA